MGGESNKTKPHKSAAALVFPLISSQEYRSFARTIARISQTLVAITSERPHLIECSACEHASWDLVLRLDAGPELLLLFVYPNNQLSTHPYLKYNITSNTFETLSMKISAKLNRNAKKQLQRN